MRSFCMECHLQQYLGLCACVWVCVSAGTCGCGCACAGRCVRVCAYECVIFICAPSNLVVSPQKCHFFLPTKSTWVISVKMGYWEKIKEEFLFEGAAHVSDEGEVGGAAADAGEGRNKHLDHQGHLDRKHHTVHLDQDWCPDDDKLTTRSKYYRRWL